MYLPKKKTKVTKIKWYNVSRTHISLGAFVTLIESGFAHPAKAEELSSAAMAVDVNALLRSCGADKKKLEQKVEEIVVGIINTPPDTPDEDSPSPPDPGTKKDTGSAIRPYFICQDCFLEM